MENLHILFQRLSAFSEISVAHARTMIIECPIRQDMDLIHLDGDVTKLLDHYINPF